jgi:hypothetical protein
MKYWIISICGFLLLLFVSSLSKEKPVSIEIGILPADAVKAPAVPPSQPRPISYTQDPAPRLDSLEMNRVFDTISNLPEVIALSNSVEKESAGKARVFVYIPEFPSKENNYYWVKAATERTDLKPDESDMTFSIYQFKVYPKTLEIQFWDVGQDTCIRLSDWRKGREKM